MHNAGDGLRFQKVMGEALVILSRSLAGSVLTASSRHKAYFRPSLCKLLEIPPKSERSHGEIVRDYKIICRRFDLLRKRLTDVPVGKLSAEDESDIKAKISEAWRDLDDLQGREAEMLRNLAFIEVHLISVKEFLDDMCEELNNDSDVSDSEKEDRNDIEDNRDYPF